MIKKLEISAEHEPDSMEEERGQRCSKDWQCIMLLLAFFHHVNTCMK